MDLPGFLQKNASQLLTLMWAHEDDQNTWCILAKAWSLVRDYQGKENSPLGAFIELNADLLGIVAPCEYLVLSGFAVVYTEEGQPSLMHVSESARHHTENPIASVEGILQNSISSGYVDVDILSRLDHNVLIVKPCIPQQAEVVDITDLANTDEETGPPEDNTITAIESSNIDLENSISSPLLSSVLPINLTPLSSSFMLNLNPGYEPDISSDNFLGAFDMNWFSTPAWDPLASADPWSTYDVAYLPLDEAT